MIFRRALLISRLGGDPGQLEGGDRRDIVVADGSGETHRIGDFNMIISTRRADSPVGEEGEAAK